jgi:hypothetical protein
MKKRFLLVAAALLVLAIAVVMAEFQQPPRHTPEPTAPLTDVAGPAPVVSVSPREEPHRRLAEHPPPGQPVPPPGTDTRPPVPEAPPARVVLPSLMPDPAHPPQWTKPLALPSTPSPPDPSVPPPIAVDPERGRHPHAQSEGHQAP